jgi:integrase
MILLRAARYGGQIRLRLAYGGTGDTGTSRRVLKIITVFHILRHTFCTALHCSGASEREAQELMRHSDPRLTAGTYTKPL